MEKISSARRLVLLLPLDTCLGATAGAQHILRAKSVSLRGLYEDAALGPLLSFWKCQLGIPLKAIADAQHTLREKSVSLRGLYQDAALGLLLRLWGTKLGIPMRATSHA